MDIGSVVDKLVGALDRSSTLDHDRWLSLNASANAMIAAEGWKDYVAAQVSYRESQELPFGPDVSLFSGPSYPVGPLGEQHTAAIRKALSSARAQYHKRRREQERHIVQ